MDELPEVLKKLRIDSALINPHDNYNDSPQIIFKNTQKLPITQVHLERPLLEIKRKSTIEEEEGFWSTVPDKSTNLKRSFFNSTIEVLPALHPIWIQHHNGYFPLASTDGEEQLIAGLTHLVQCSYHEFWCLVLFEAKVATAIRSILLNVTQWCPVTLHLLYLTYKRLVTCQESETEYMPEDIMFNFLIQHGYLNLQIVLTLIFLYEKLDLEFAHKLSTLYFHTNHNNNNNVGTTKTQIIRQKEIDEMLQHTVMTLEMVIGQLCGFSSSSTSKNTVPLAIEPKPSVFSQSWTYKLTNYLWYTITMLRLLISKCGTGKCHLNNDVMKLCLAHNQIAFRLPDFYERIYAALYELLEGRKELALEDNIENGLRIYTKLAEGREQFVHVFHSFVEYCIQQAIDNVHNASEIEQIVELYNNLFTNAMENEFFICDYNEVYNVSDQNEIFSCYTNFDKTRSDYLTTCINNFRRHNALWKALKTDEKTLRKTIEKYTTDPNESCAIMRAFTQKLSKTILTNGTIEINEPKPTTSTSQNPKIQKKSPDDQIETTISTILDMFPHLGAGFIQKCLESYDFQTDQVITAILEENLPPHLLEIPLDMVRVPPEPRSPPPLAVYHGKKNTYTDPLQLLNDTKARAEIKTHILDGIKYSEEYDMYDDEYDDRADDLSPTIPVRDVGDHDIFKYNPNHDDAVSDTSCSDTESLAEDSSTKNVPSDMDFCQNPVILRAQREAKYQQVQNRQKSSKNPSTSANGSNVVGKAKGQGQDKDVLRNRYKKNVNKSTRANHNRKTGAQWKRNRGMFPA